MNKTHPRVAKKYRIDGSVQTFEFWSPCVDTGCHCCCGCNTPSKLSGYGSGIVLYFKAWYALSCMLFFMSLLSVPPLLLYYSGTTVDVVSAVDALGLLTMANLGEGLTVCDSGLDGSTLNVTCPAGARIGSIEAYYGNPAGECGCPGARTPDPSCPGEESGSRCKETGSAFDQFCFLDQQRTVNLPSGSSFTTGPCCASQLQDNLPVFPELDIAVDRGCTSTSAQTIARGLCIGKTECEVPVNATTPVTWRTDAKYQTSCDPVVADGALCTMTLDDGLPNDLCASRLADPEIDNSGSHQRRMVLVAVCYQTNLELFDGSQTYTKEEVAVFIMLFDLAAVLIFLGTVCWLDSAERDEDKHIKYSLNKRFSAADYSIYIPELPPHESIELLEQDLKLHFERELSKPKYFFNRDLPRITRPGSHNVE